MSSDTETVRRVRSRPVLTAARLRELFAYDPETGIFAGLQNRSGRKMIGRVAGHLMSCGYWRMGIDGRKYLAHRMAWLYMTGEMPGFEVDHINGNRLDNRFANLRLADFFHNQQNRRGPQRNSTTGLLGVTKSGNQWGAQITSKGRRIHLGRFKTADEAYGVYLKAKRELHPGGLL